MALVYNVDMLDILTGPVAFALLIVLIYMTFWFILSLIFERNDIADIAWGLGFITVAWAFRGKYDPPVASNFTLILVLTTLWGLRLATHIFSRNVGKAEDYRYKAWRDEWGKWFFLRSYLQVFLLQGLFMVLISFSAAVAVFGPSRVGFFGVIGTFLWILGFVFESLGDWQLRKFIKNPHNKGKIMKDGLWKYTRHPNYFGEVAQWWGIFLITFSSPYFLLAAVSPLVITYLLLKVSGIPMLEKKYEDNAEFQEYKKVTNAFFPWFPKKSG